MPSKQFVIQSRDRSTDGELAPLGSRRDIESALAARNTMADHPGGETLYGPGIELCMASPDETLVRQMLLTINDEDIAWDVVLRLAREFQWKIVDPSTGRELSP
jgi:hypothetical protein